MSDLTGLPWLTILGLVPLVGALLVAVLPSGRDALAKTVALVVSLVVLALTILVCALFEPGGDRFQFVQAHDWIPAFGVQYAVGADGIALVLIALIAVLVPVVVLASWYDADPQADRLRRVSVSGVRAAAAGSSASSRRVGGGTAVLDAPAAPSPPSDELPPRRSVKTFFALLLLLETMMIGVFAATDVFLFYVFFEAMLIPMYFIIGSYGGPRRSYAAMKFLLYSLFGGLLMLAAVIGLYVVSASQGEGTFAFEQLLGLHEQMSTTVEIALFSGFFIAFAIKAPLFPFHTWLPDAGAEAPVGGAVLLVGVLDKVGTFGFLRYCLPLFPEASRILGPYVIALCVIGILYGALLAMGQKDLKRLVSYTSVAHFGFIGMGIFAFTTQGQSGAVLYMVNHGLSTGALFLVVGFLIVRGRSRLIPDYSGVANVAPILAGTFLLAGLSSLALPGLSTFISEFLVLLGTYSRYPVAAVLAALGVILAALYVLLMYQRTMQGPLRLPALLGDRMPDLRLREVLAVAPLLALMIVLGVYPKPLLDVINPAVEATMQDVGRTDPAPTAND
ncbi:MAG: NADH-ubiquinone oxidoreductase chain M [uncultured Frankineae bacterium]|uniref:NADH-ubiquinone oxidoreductase chain M n=1 Tax=uncultured Frankineae bacterium TaxID=437475 RepID=A0A6J4M629_9ACTN|nr:MAG: NADH-ubiquinone oxidoreductase chain M [uncultured Frankineae bacterium]